MADFTSHDWGGRLSLVLRYHARLPARLAFSMAYVNKMLLYD